MHRLLSLRHNYYNNITQLQVTQHHKYYCTPKKGRDTQGKNIIYYEQLEHMDAHGLGIISSCVFTYVTHIELPAGGESYVMPR